MSKKFYETLFNPGEGVCWSDGTKGTRVFPLESWSTNGGRFFCINPLSLVGDANPTEKWHDSLEPRRADCNVIAYRNILCEFDKISLANQQIIIDKSEIPYTSIVYSGGKSYHLIISLETSLVSEIEYRKLVRRVHNKLGGKEVVDISTINPSRFSRVPEVYRDNGVFQTLMHLKERVPTQTLLNWLGPESIQEEVLQQVPTKQKKRILRPDTNYFLFNGAEAGHWNINLFKAVADMARAGYTKEEITAQVQSIAQYQLDSSDKRTIESAIKKVNNG